MALSTPAVPTAVSAAWRLPVVAPSGFSDRIALRAGGSGHRDLRVSSRWGADVDHVDGRLVDQPRASRSSTLRSRTTAPLARRPPPARRRSTATTGSHRQRVVHRRDTVAVTVRPTHPPVADDRRRESHHGHDLVPAFVSLGDRRGPFGSCDDRLANRDVVEGVVGIVTGAPSRRSRGTRISRLNALSYDVISSVRHDRRCRSRRLRPRGRLERSAGMVRGTPASPLVRPNRRTPSCSWRSPAGRASGSSPGGAPKRNIAVTLGRAGRRSPGGPVRRARLSPRSARARGCRAGQ